jgi:hypothetical protein
MNDTNASQGNLNQDLEEGPDGKKRPITRDIKLRSNANRNNTTGNPTSQGKQYQNTQSALSGKDEPQTFQNTINIGSFINEINNKNAGTTVEAAGSIVNSGTQGSIEQIKVA